MWVKVAPGMGELVFKMERGVKVTGRVVDGAGKGVEKMWVNVGGLETGDLRYMRETNGNGEFSVVVPASTGVGQKMYRVAVYRERSGAVPVWMSEEFMPEVGIGFLLWGVGAMCLVAHEARVKHRDCV